MDLTISTSREDRQRERTAIARLFEALLVDFYHGVSNPAAGVAHSRRIEELRAAARAYGRTARKDCNPEVMLVQLKATLATSAARFRAFERDQLAHEVTSSAIEGYYGG